MTEIGRRVLVGVATVGPCGFVPRAPGTVGSLAGVALFWAVRSAHSFWLEAVVLFAVVLVGVVAASEAESKYQHRDPGHIVIDEVAGMLLTLLAVPVGVGGVMIRFVVFRVFDIVWASTISDIVWASTISVVCLGVPSGSSPPV